MRDYSRALPTPALAQPEARAIGRPAPAARLVSFRPAPRPGGALHGYATIDFNGTSVTHQPLFHDASGGLSAGTPGVPDFDANGKQRERDGKRLWRQVVTFTTAEARARWQRAVLGALVAAGIGAP